MTHAGYFEGIGGFSLGAERAGFETIYTCEIDDFRHDWLKYYLPNATHEKDITTTNGMYADIFTAGFPCQDISLANPKGKGLQGSRSGLFFEFVQFVRRFRPKYVVLENSPNVISKRYLLDILGEFTQIGYNAEWDVISKRAFGYPDERERFICVAYRDEIGRFQTKGVFNSNDFETCGEKITGQKHLFSLPDRNASDEIWRSFISQSCTSDTGLPRELVAQEIAAYGDAICPDVAQLVFELIKIHAEQ